ncbi:hypothetical protein SUNI508_09387 [Seiridium unicorne]|uniref:Uncharacterized protein n=1 Tax=Seiridium unicorne TaxID=138068 RepID=A0ABR2UQH0_9PEZI
MHARSRAVSWSGRWVWSGLVLGLGWKRQMQMRDAKCGWQSLAPGCTLRRQQAIGAQDRVVRVPSSTIRWKRLCAPVQCPPVVETPVQPSTTYRLSGAEAGVLHRRSPVLHTDWVDGSRSPPAQYHVPMQYAASMSHARFRHAADTIAALALSLVMCYGREDTRLARSGDVALRDEREVSRLPAMILRVQLASDERSSASPASVA